MTSERRIITFTGRVQGVGFRMTTLHLAQDLPLAGTVRNLPDGGVELVAQGESHHIETLLARLHEHFGSFIRTVQQTTAPATSGASPAFGLSTKSPNRIRMFYAIAAIIVILIPVLIAWLLRARTGWEIRTYVTLTAILTILGVSLLAFTPATSAQFQITYSQMTGLYILALAIGAILFGIVEFGLLRLVGLFRLGAITRVTYYEALLQPFTLILIFLGIALITIGGFFPYFTIDEDHKMYRDIAISLAFLFTLPIMIFSSTKVIDEEIENRTMLTLMSKPIARWQVVLGKYFGVLLLCFVIILALGVVASVCSYLRYFDDKRVDYSVATPPERIMLDFVNIHALRALAPALLLQFLQIATLAAVSVAVSTRFGLALNITIVVILYMAANLMRYATAADLPGPIHALIAAIAALLPGLSYLDLNQRLVYGDYNYGDTNIIPGLPSYSQIWQYVACASLYAVLYISAALSFGIALFRTRELS